MTRGRAALASFNAYRQAVREGDEDRMRASGLELQKNLPYFGYGHISDRSQLVPPLTLLFWSFRVMVGLGSLFCLVFVLLLFLQYRGWVERYPLLLRVAFWCIPLVYICSQAGWVCAEVGRQPWAIQDMLPVHAAISSLQTSSVRITFFLFLIIFTLLLIAEIRILCKAVQKGPQIEESAMFGDGQ